MKKLLASSLLAAFLVFSGAALAHPAGQEAPKKAAAADKDKDKDKKGTKKAAKKGKKAASDTSAPDKKGK